MEKITLPILDVQGKEVGSITLDSAVFDGVVNEGAIHQVVTAYRSSQRKGLASTKTRGEVSGGGKKPWKQKGTGRARVGSTRSPLWRHGGVIFGPHPRDFGWDIPKKIRDVALRSALCAKLKENNLIVLEDFKIPSNKTKEAAKVFVNIKAVADKSKKDSKSVLLLLDAVDKNSDMSLRNLGKVDFNLARMTNTYEVLRAKKIVITKQALGDLTKRLKG